MNLNNPCKNSFSVAVVLFAMLLSSGCATGKNAQQSPYRYGNPDYNHISELPWNQAAARKDENASAAEEMTAQEYEVIGDVMLKQKNYPLAFIQYGKALAKMPGNCAIEYKIGLTFLEAGKFDDALAQFRKMSDQNCKKKEVTASRGKAFFLKKDYASAKTYLLKALALDNDLWECRNYLGYIYDKSGDHNAAVAQYMAALVVNPGNGSLYNNLGVSYSLWGRYLEAIEAFKGALAHNYKHQKVYNNLGLALANSGQYGQALETFKKVLPEHLAYSNLGGIHLNAGHYDAAIDCFEKAMELNPRFDPRIRKSLQLARTEKMRRGGLGNSDPEESSFVDYQTGGEE